MCISSSASFTLAVLLAALGAASIGKARQRIELLFACIPLIFAIQQFAEGLIWVSMGNLSLYRLRTDLAYFYLFVAESVWPVLIPLALLLPERDRVRRNILRMLLIIGIFTSLYLAFYLFTYSVGVTVADCHIRYMQHQHSPYHIMASLPYLFAILAPFWVSGIRGMYRLAVALTLSYLAAKVLYDRDFVSAWCFFAAVISGFIYWIFASGNGAAQGLQQLNNHDKYENR
ncbi:hypothetical protein HYN59_15255 [Flavobacterium album]|uniref:Uncharacterized protein n=1 Tax=Flavobacterium album TaxID=2175091 RepID=A0A2S1R192_9FLAO|nr:DUF6629 family protein [Flavobacterium album]AWH86382.1 hypothetical protein HYN59_15255 [Flavobacterium album]